MISIKGVEVLQKYDMFRLNDLWIASGKRREKFHPMYFVNLDTVLPLLHTSAQNVLFKKGRYGGVYGAQWLALAYAEWVSEEVHKEFSKQLSKPAPKLRSKSTKVDMFEEPLVPVTRLCEEHAKKYYWDEKSPQQMNLILAALGYQKEGRPFLGAHGKTIKQWELTEAGKSYAAEFTTLHGQKYVRWSLKILDKIKRG